MQLYRSSMSKSILYSQEIFSKYDDDFDEEKPVFSDIEEEMEDYERYWEEDQTYGNTSIGKSMQ